ncbi:hypothetical protein G6F37_000633 [Rhizopus arrhizus]|nr:hypothetical protein G6F38_002688 [Rhizopus arrhizus]KAG1164066.1 hypothetical protein G6F37_000633 [Rhizopus arrhizus]
MIIVEMMETMTSEFMGLKISKITVYAFATNKYNISFKRASFHPVERNTPKRIEERYEWVQSWSHTDIDFMSNCVFIDESAFHINMKHTCVGFRKEEPAIVTVTKIRARTITILGAISTFGVINVKITKPKAAKSSKKRKLAGSNAMKSNQQGEGGHYFDFVASIMDTMNQYDEIKNNYITMDNVSIHTYQNTKNCIESRGYSCIYFPPYSPALNPIEKLWVVCKSKVKQETLLKEETFTSRIIEACNKAPIT